MPELSKRSEKGTEMGAGMRKFVKVYANAFDKDKNPDGIVSLGVAENHLMDKEIMEKIRQAAVETFDLPDLGYGDGLTGSRRLAKAMSGFFNDYFHPLEKVDPEQIVFVFDQLGHVLCDDGDAVLISVPHYNAYTWDFSLRTNAKVVPVPVASMDEGFELDSIEAWKQTVDKLRAEGTRPRMMIITNPHNPLGRTYPRETLIAFAKFAQEEDLHLIMNEIYAKSIYDNEDWPDAPPFVSALSIDYAKELGGTFDKSRLHLVYGMSKDFCANGLRIGVLLSQYNQDLITALSGTGFFMKDAIWSHILNDREWLDWFLVENKKRLGEAAKFTREWFGARGIPVSRSNAGNFMFVDFSKRFDIKDEQAEIAIADKVTAGGVYLGRGGTYHQPTPGWFRVTFCSDPEKLKVALDRLEKTLDLTPLVNGMAKLSV